MKIGGVPGTADIVVASDSWRALLGRFAAEADWDAANPIGPALAAVITAVEVFKRLLAANNGTPRTQFAPSELRLLRVQLQDRHRRSCRTRCELPAAR